MLLSLVPLLYLFGLVYPQRYPQIRDLEFGDLNFLHTTDTHGWYSGHLNQKIYGADWGDFVSFAHHLRQLAHANGHDLLLIDSGDRHDGNGLSDITEPNGARSLPIFIQQDYDLLTLGNHELYVAENLEQEYEIVASHYGEKFVSTNVEYLKGEEWVPLGQKYRYFTTPIHGTRVLGLGFMFDFKRYNEKTRVTPISEVIEHDWFQQILDNYPEEIVDTVVVVTHVPVDRKWNELALLHAELRTHYPQVKIEYFGGHSHIRDFVVYDENLVALQSGRFCETVGFLGVHLNSTSENAADSFTRKYIDFNTQLFLHHSKKDTLEEFDTKKGLSVKHMIAEAREELGLDEVIGHVKKSNYFMDYVPTSHLKSLYRLLTKKVLPSLKPSADVETSQERLIIINTGSIRYDLYKGPYTIDTHYIISPFKNDWVRITVPKYIATQIAPKLNKNGYIMAQGEKFSNENDQLKPPQQWDKDRLKKRGQHPIEFSEFDVDLDLHKDKLKKGYVTHDDFGNTGDDTPHKAVINYPIPNVVQSVELKNTGRKAPVDVVFYNFITPNVKQVFEEIRYPIPKIEFYSDKYLGQLLNDYVAANEI
uniref:Putative 5'-nucleotidase C-terminal domain-containing protein n=1 Tax=Candidozyma auris TaxID=498019 RepID=A0A0L0NW62_CANAR